MMRMSSSNGPERDERHRVGALRRDVVPALLEHRGVEENRAGIDVMKVTIHNHPVTVAILR